jgi:geranylgeranyl pyrophosphate synthase
MMLFGDSSVTGKPKDDDIRDGMYTQLYDTALSRASSEQKNRLRTLHGKRDILPAEADEYRAIMYAVGADQEHNQAAIEYLEHAGNKLHDAWQYCWNPQVLEYLESLIQFLMAKDYRS